MADILGVGIEDTLQHVCVSALCDQVNRLVTLVDDLDRDLKQARRIDFLFRYTKPARQALLLVRARRGPGVWFRPRDNAEHCFWCGKGGMRDNQSEKRREPYHIVFPFCCPTNSVLPLFGKCMTVAVGKQAYFCRIG
jgi:hypothetical protein